MRIKSLNIWKPWQGSNSHEQFKKSAVIINQWNSSSNVERFDIVAMTIDVNKTQVAK